MENPVLTVRELHKNFKELEVLKGIDLTVGRGDVVGLIGSSGSGKSTMLRCINYLEKPTLGEIRLEGEIVGMIERGGQLLPASTKVLSRQRRRMAMVFQNFNLWPHRTALENVIEGPVVVQRVARKLALEKGMALLEKVGLAHKQDQYPSQLSGGQQQRVAIARALALEPTLLLFDEPTSALDPELVGEVLGVMKQLAQEGMTMIVVTHEMAFAHEVCSHVVFLESGRVSDAGSPDHIFSRDNEKTAQFLKRYLA